MHGARGRDGCTPQLMEEACNYTIVIVDGSGYHDSRPGRMPSRPMLLKSEICRALVVGDHSLPCARLFHVRPPGANQPLIWAGTVKASRFLIPGACCLPQAVSAAVQPQITNRWRVLPAASISHPPIRCNIAISSRCGSDRCSPITLPIAAATLRSIAHFEARPDRQHF
jgi:hypothetical protein